LKSVTKRLAGPRKWRRNGKLGPYSAIARLDTPDGRTREGRLWRKTYEDLVEYCGGQPTVPQKTIIPRICALVVKTAYMDHVAETCGRYMDERDTREHLSTVSAIAKLMKLLGPDQRDTARKSKASSSALADYLARATSEAAA
jgi:hypothetical protein